MSEISGSREHREALETRLNQRIPDPLWRELSLEFNVQALSNETDLGEMVSFLRNNGLKGSMKSRNQTSFENASREALQKSRLEAARHRPIALAVRKSLLGTEKPLRPQDLVGWIQKESKKQTGGVEGFLPFATPDSKWIQFVRVAKKGQLHYLHQGAGGLASLIFPYADAYAIAQTVGFILVNTLPLITPITVKIGDPSLIVEVKANLSAVPKSLLTWAATQETRRILRRHGINSAHRSRPAPKARKVQAFLETRKVGSRDLNLRNYNRQNKGEEYDSKDALYRALYRDRFEVSDWKAKFLRAVCEGNQDLLRADFERLVDNLDP